MADFERKSLLERTREFRFFNDWNVRLLREPVMIWSLNCYGPLTRKFGLWRYEFNGVSHVERARWTERVNLLGLPRSIARRIVEFGRPPVTPLTRTPPPNTCPGLFYQTIDPSWSVLFQLLPADLVLHVTKFYDWPNEWRAERRRQHEKRRQFQYVMQQTMAGDALMALTRENVRRR
jgi:hypothetical protein